MSTSEDTKMKPHIHKDTIIAWANGAQIQWYRPSIDRWMDIPKDETPEWSVNTKYRVKPDIETQLMYELANCEHYRSYRQIAQILMEKFNITLKD